MKVYKFRALSNVERIADILVNKRFYASKYADLNDPMEGVFNHQADVNPKFIEKIKEDREKTRICSFSKSFASPQLWAYYADEFKGISLEVELDESICCFIQEVAYDNRLLTLYKELEPFEGIFHSIVLSRKYEAWASEEEVRVLSEDEFVTFPCAKITAILYGLRTPDSVKLFVEKVKDEHIQSWNTGINNYTGKVEKSQL